MVNLSCLEGMIDDLAGENKLNSKQILDLIFVPSSYVRTIKKKIGVLRIKDRTYRIEAYSWALAGEAVRLGIYGVGGLFLNSIFHNFDKF